VKVTLHDCLACSGCITSAEVSLHPLFLPDAAALPGLMHCLAVACVFGKDTVPFWPACQPDTDFCPAWHLCPWLLVQSAAAVVCVPFDGGASLAAGKHVAQVSGVCSSIGVGSDTLPTWFFFSFHSLLLTT